MEYFLIGKTLSHTLSPQIHKLFGRDYGVKEIADENELSAFFAQRNFKGINVTIPYKSAIIKYLDEIDETAKNIGAVNTVINKNGKLFGYNSDVLGLSGNLKYAHIDLYGKNVLILGSGGTSKTASYLAKIRGAKNINIVSRNGAINYKNAYDFCETEVIVNTTPVGMYPDCYKSLINIEKFEKLESYFDVIYNPFNTLSVLKAKSLGLNAANGFFMLVEQARIAENYFGQVDGSPLIEAEKSKEVFSWLMKQNLNLTLTGMAGAGKSALGREIAKLLDRPFVDIDKEIEKIENMSVENIFSSKGEKYFRRIESIVLEKFLKEKGQIIALGGGAVLSEKNRFFIKANSFVCNVIRDVENLDLSGRPLSKSKENVKTLYEQRKKFYIEVADYEVYNDNELTKVAKEIACLYEKHFDH